MHCIGHSSFLAVSYTHLDVYKRQVRSQRRVRGRGPHVDALGLDVQLAGQAEQLDQRLARRGEGIARRHRVLRLDVDDQLVEVGALLDSGGLDPVGDLSLIHI